MYVKYFADDDTEFETEEECEQYEYNMKMKDKFPTTRFFNRNGKAVPFMASLEFCEGLFYIEVNNMDEALLLHEWFNDCGMESPWVPRCYRDGTTITIGRFFYDTDIDRWRNIEELYKAYADVRDIFQRDAE